MKKWLSVLLIGLLAGCNSENEEEDQNAQFFPVVSYLNSQVAHVDTSLYRIIKIITVDGVSDTTYIPREQFRNEAKDFISIPDIASKKLKKRYTETELYDEEMNSVVLTYAAKKENMEIRRVDVAIEPNMTAGDKVTSIFIDQWKEAGDSSIQNKMIWYVGKSFQVNKIIQTPNKPERIVKTEVIWNDHADDFAEEQ